MVFWKTYPLSYLIQSLWNLKPFISYPFTKQPLSSPTGISCEIFSREYPIHCPNEIIYYLQTYFGIPPHKPILIIPEKSLLGPRDILLIVRDISTKIVGCIRYHYIGEFIDEPIYVVDCFCIHPEWRGKGVGDYLLTELHLYANNHQIPHAMFLKEGSLLPIIQIPLYTGTYVYRELSCYSISRYIRNLSIPEAYRLIDIYCKVYPNQLIIRNSETSNQIWKLYKKGFHSILVCFQDTFQKIDENNKYKKIGWITAWLESSLITDEIRKEASKELTDTMYGIFDYIWMNQAWIGSSSLWKVDGTFHWYSYQWTTGLPIHRSYCILT
jgi:GNAT superfamily N-acetyltransferase